MTFNEAGEPSWEQGRLLQDGRTIKQFFDAEDEKEENMPVENPPPEESKYTL